MARIRVYVKPFDEDGNYLSDFIEITNYVEAVGKISIEADSSEFQLGVYRNSNVTLTVTNREGLFSNIESDTSLFRYKRGDSIVKITWDINDDDIRAGWVYCGEFLTGEEIEVFRGLLNDDNLVENVRSEKVTFNVLGFESLFARVETPVIANGTTVTNAIYECLNQTAITDLLTVSLANITPDLSQAIDVGEDLENQTVKESLDDLLLKSNSILKIIDQVVYITNRDPSAEVEHTFYGQASQVGEENIIDIDNISSGVHRMFNFITWGDTVSAADPDSTARRGIKKKELSTGIFTDSTKIANVLNALVAEFKDPKQEFDLKTVFNYETLALNLLDTVNIDYPSIVIPSEGEELPICGIAICGEAVLPLGIWSLIIPSDREFKILKKDIDLKKQEITFKLREV